MPCARPQHCAPKRVILSINPRAGARHREDLVGKLKELLQEQGMEVMTPESLEELKSLLHDPEVQSDLRAVVAGGGDGTVALVANLAPPGTPIAILPLGTENLLSKYLQIPPNPVKIARIIDEGVTVQIDAGQAGERLFLLMAGIGFDADVVRRMHEQRTGHINHLSYAKPIFEAIRNYQYPELRVYCRDDAGDSHTFTARWVFVINVPRYARGLAISPHAAVDDGYLNVCTFKEGSLFNGLVYLSGVVLGQHAQWEDFVTHKASEVRIESDSQVPFQLDGDPGGSLPIEIKVLPKRLTLLVDHAWAKEHGFMAEPTAS